MGDKVTIVVDTNVLLNLATPIVDGRSKAPTGDDPLRAVLTSYDVHVPSRVLGEVSEAVGSGDLLSAAADTVLKASHQFTTCDVEDKIDAPLEYGLDPGESHGIWLANDIDAEMFVTDEFNSTNYLFVAMALENRNILFTTPHVLCKLAEQDVLDTGYVDAALTYYVKTKNWDRQYISRLPDQYLNE